MTEETKCPHCGKPVTHTGLSGICPECMLQAGAPTQGPRDEVGANGTKLVEPPICLSPAQIAQYFPQLEILECLGRGGMGVVYKARQPKLNRLVGLPFLAGIAFGIRMDQPLLGAAGWAGWIGCLVVFFNLRQQRPHGAVAKSVAEPGKIQAEKKPADGSARRISSPEASASPPDRSASRAPSPNAPVRAGREPQPFFNSLFLLFSSPAKGCKCPPP